MNHGSHLVFPLGILPFEQGRHGFVEASRE
jgi:hypothetical protein